jgi:hypothetical protein
MRRLKAPQVPLKEATVFHIAQLRDVFAVCDPERPQEELILRMLVGSGVRAAELCGLAVRGPDGYLFDQEKESTTCRYLRCSPVLP